ncbi:MAG: hypothetical protein KGJ57_17320 [Sphingomonadales bacterium]|nr:hypothetical protein [Sphingomonadales bacterium]MDE2171158.1 hypothetical protein [Sphingomonadales bacterium]
MRLSQQLSALLDQGASPYRLGRWLARHGAAVLEEVEKGERMVAIAWLDLNDREAVSRLVGEQRDGHSKMA